LRRRRVRLVLLAVVAVTGLSAGCAATPKVGDGAIGPDWAAFAEPKVPTPESGGCRSGSADLVEWDLPLFDSTPVPCTNAHRSETYHVGTLSGAAASQVGPPDFGDEVYRAAYAGCAMEATSFLGGDWHRARVAVVPVLPSERQWRGKARWYRCEMLEVKDAREAMAERSASVRDGLLGSKPAAVTCANDTLGDKDRANDNVIYVACSAPHTVELTGLYTPADGKYPGATAAIDKALDACYVIGARYLGMTKSALDNRGGIQWIAWERGEAPWSIGDRSTRCYLGPYPAKKIKGSIKGRRPPF